MQNSSSLKIANRSVGEWIASLPTLFILLITIFVASGEIIHSQLLRVGEATWQEYFLLRGAGAVQEPTCNQDPDIDAEVQRVVAEREAEMADDPLADMFGLDIDEGAIRRSLEGSRQVCRERWDRFQRIEERVTPGVIAFRTVEVGVANLVTGIGEYRRLLLALLLLICAATTTLARHHIAIRPAKSSTDYYVATGAQLIANSILFFSAVAYRERQLISIEEGIQVSHFYLNPVWITGFGLLAAFNIYQLLRKPKHLDPGGNPLKALLSVPLYAYMAISAGSRFLADGYYHGVSVYLGMMMEHSTMFLNLALYIWIGMMLKRTRLAQLVFNVFRPWNMSPELLCFTVLLVTAVPTAYTGASGIFVIAAGAVIYSELMRAGARPQMALATTAMSGSMGVVLRPCLLVVIIAALNNAVTTAELFGSGVKIFFLTAFLFLIFSQISRKEPARIAPVKEALPESVRRLKPIIPYVFILAGIVMFFSYVLERRLDEFSAPIILPVILLGFLIYEYVFSKKTAAELNLDDDSAGGNEPRPTGFEPALRAATNETTTHIGALLLLMALSVSVGGIIERTGLMDAVPQDMANVWLTAALLALTLVGIGMIMDPYGAVILVNATIAPIAIANGIDPLHFWMMCLVAFELGYLTPPVALNHLLTRQVVGEKAVEDARLTTGSFWDRYEKFLLPIAVMLTALIMVTFLPLAFEPLHDWVFQKVARG